MLQPRWYQFVPLFAPPPASLGLILRVPWNCLVQKKLRLVLSASSPHRRAVTSVSACPGSLKHSRRPRIVTDLRCLSACNTRSTPLGHRTFAIVRLAQRGSRLSLACLLSYRIRTRTPGDPAQATARLLQAPSSFLLSTACLRTLVRSEPWHERFPCFRLCSF
ncbi:hypothetical protein VTK56DRAFT_9006 [Thermocarpiscus australiensis]